MLLRGDIKLQFYDKDVFSKDDLMFTCWLHSSMLRDNPRLVLHRLDLDKAVKKKNKDKFPKDFHLEIVTQPQAGGEEGGEGEEGSDESSSEMEEEDTDTDGDEAQQEASARSNPERSGARR